MQSKKLKKTFTDFFASWKNSKNMHLFFIFFFCKVKKPREHEFFGKLRKLKKLVFTFLQRKNLKNHHEMQNLLFLCKLFSRIMIFTYIIFCSKIFWFTLAFSKYHLECTVQIVFYQLPCYHPMNNTSLTVIRTIDKRTFYRLFICIEVHIQKLKIPHDLLDGVLMKYFSSVMGWYLFLICITQVAKIIYPPQTFILKT